MRILAILLLLANVVLWTWQQGHLPWFPWQAQDFQTATPTPLAGVPTLVLAREQPAVLDAATYVKVAAVQATESIPSDSNDTLTMLTVSDDAAESNTLQIAKVELNAPPNKTLATVTDAPPTSSENTAVPLPMDMTIALDDDTMLASATDSSTSSRNTLAAKTEVLTTESMPKSAPNVSPASHQTLSSKPEADMPTSLTATTDPDIPAIDTLASLASTAANMIPRVMPIDNTEQAKTASTSTIDRDSTRQITRSPPPVSIKTADQTKTSNKPQKVNKTSTTKVKTNAASTTQRVIRAWCYQVGPYTQKQSANTAAQWLRSQTQVTTQVQRRLTPVLVSTRLYLPVQRNYQSALSLQQRLRTHGIGDHYVIKQGKLKNAIALGLYRDPLSVTRRLTHLRQKGFNNVKTVKNYQKYPRYWLNVRFKRENSVVLQRFKQRPGGFNLQPVTCK